MNTAAMIAAIAFAFLVVYYVWRDYDATRRAIAYAAAHPQHGFAPVAVPS